LLNNRKTIFSNSTNDIDRLIDSLDQKHALQRKCQFLLDIRGYIKENKIFGNYVEFGSYLSRTSYIASKIFPEINIIQCDLFDQNNTTKLITYKQDEPFINHTNDYFKVSLKDIQQFQTKFNGKGVVIDGDFRDISVQKQILKEGPYSICILDCNFLSSIEAALETFINAASPGAVIFFDDYFLNLKKGNPLIGEMLKKFKNFNFYEHGFYAPFGKSFILGSTDL